MAVFAQHLTHDTESTGTRQGLDTTNTVLQERNRVLAIGKLKGQLAKQRITGLDKLMCVCVCVYIHMYP